MSIQAVSWVITHSKAKLAARLVLLSIANHADAYGRNAYPSIPTIAAEAGVCERQVQRSIVRLEAIGELAVDRGIAKNGTSLYIMTAMGGGDNLSGGVVTKSRVGGDILSKKRGQDVTRTVREPSYKKGAPSGAPVDPVKVIQEMAGIWREVCGHIHTPTKIDKNRGAKLLGRWKDSFDKNTGNWRAYCERVAASPLLSGQKRDWHADLDWVLEPRNLRKIVEGRYDETAPAEDRPFTPHELWEGRLIHYRDKGRWVTERWGPPPEHPGCEALPDLLVEFGHRERERVA